MTKKFKKRYVLSSFRVNSKYKRDLSVAITKYECKYNILLGVSPKELDQALKTEEELLGPGFGLVKRYDRIKNERLLLVNKAVEDLSLGKIVDLEKLVE